MPVHLRHHADCVGDACGIQNAVQRILDRCRRCFRASMLALEQEQPCTLALPPP